MAAEAPGTALNAGFAIAVTRETLIDAILIDLIIIGRTLAHTGIALKQ